MKFDFSILAIPAVVLAILAVNPLAHADDTSIGCGLGTQLIKRNSLISTTTRGYLNFTFSNSSGMTSGTSGCAKHSIVMNEKKAEHFAEANYHVLMVEMASGRGEHLAGFASALGCGAGSAGAFGKMTQDHYEKIYPSDEVGATQMLDNVQRQIQSDPVLSLTCSA
jgi:hypothetical protein